jgi:hypothetical protein
MMPPTVPPVIADLLRRHRWLIFVPLLLILIVAVLMLLLAFTVIIVPIGALIIYGLYRLFLKFLEWARVIDQVDTIRPENQTPEAVDRLPKSPDFVLSEPGAAFKPSTETATALRRYNRGAAMPTLYLKPLENRRRTVAQRLDLAAINSRVVNTINPDRIVPQRASAHLRAAISSGCAAFLVEREV